MNGQTRDNDGSLAEPTSVSESVYGAVNVYASKIKETDWVTKVNEMLKHAVQLEVPRELTVDGQFYDLLKPFAQAVSVLNRLKNCLWVPWTEDGKTMFMINGLMEFTAEKLASFTRAQIQERLKKLNDNQECNGHKNLQTRWGRTTLRVWWVPA